MKRTHKTLAKFISLMLVLTFVATAFSGCATKKSVNEQISPINDQVTAINNSITQLQTMSGEHKDYIAKLEASIKTLETGLATANTTIAVLKSDLLAADSALKSDLLAELTSLKTATETEITSLKTQIAALQTKDTELDGKITTLQTYVDTKLKAETDWANATFATLEQYSAVQTEIAGIKSSIEQINKDIADLEERVNTKIATDIEAAISALRTELSTDYVAKIATAVAEVTSAYTSAVATAKTEITNAYTEAISTAIKNSEDGMKEWVNKVLADGYYTIAEVDAKIEATEDKMSKGDSALESKVEAHKTEVQSAIDSLQEIDSQYGEYINSLNGSVSALETSLANTNTLIATVKQELIDREDAIKVELLNSLEDLKVSTENEIASIKAQITNLIAKDKEIDGKIVELKSYVDTEFDATKDWTSATFSTLEQYGETQVEIGSIKASINQINKGIADLEERVNNKIANDISTAIEALRKELGDDYTEKIAFAVSHVTQEYTNAIATAKSEITAAYTSAIKDAIENSENSTKNWVTQTLEDGYYNIVAIDAIIKATEDKMTSGDVALMSKIEEQQRALADAKTELTEQYKLAISTAIEDYNGVITGYTNNLVEDVKNHIQVQINGINENLASLQSQINTINNTIASLDDRLTNAENDIVDLEGKLQEAESAIIELNNKLNITNNNIVNLESALGTAQNDINNLREALGESVKELEESIDAANTLIAELEQELLANDDALKAELLAELTSLRDSTAAEISAIKTKLASLDEMDKTLDEKIDNLESSIDSEISGTVEWVNATFATLTQYSEIQSEIGSIKATIAQINSDISALETRVNNKIATDIKTAIDALRDELGADYTNKIEAAVSSVTGAYTNAIATAKSEIVAAYTAAINSLNAQIVDINKVIDSLRSEMESVKDILDNLGDRLENLETPHNFSPWFGNTEYEGLHQRYCFDCGYTESKWYCAGNHQGGEWITDTEPNCINEGTTYKLCTKCNEICERGTTPKLGHTFVDGICSVCGDEDGLQYVLSSDETYYIVKEIGSCTDTEVTIADTYKGKPIKAIGNSAFANQTQITKIHIPDSITIIGNNAFEGCTGLTEITIPSSVESIGSQIFRKCTSLNTVYYNSDRKYVSGLYSGVFNVPSIKKVVFGGTEVPENALRDCSNVTDVVILDGVKYIRSNAFYNCSSLVNVTIPDSVTKIEGQAFCECSSLTDIVIPDSVTEIGIEAFRDCYSLTSVVISNNVKHIDQYAFYSCENLTDVVIKNGVERIGTFAFSYCDIKKLVLPDSVAFVENSAFSYCRNLETVVLPDSIANIHDSAFGACDNLQYVFYKGTAEDWEYVSVGSNNDSINYDTVYFYSEEKPTSGIGNAWHYVDGRPMAWPWDPNIGDWKVVGSAVSSEYIPVPKYKYDEKGFHTISPDYTGYTPHFTVVSRDMVDIFNFSMTIVVHDYCIEGDNWLSFSVWSESSSIEQGNTSGKYGDGWTSLIRPGADGNVNRFESWNQTKGGRTGKQSFINIDATQALPVVFPPIVDAETGDFTITFAITDGVVTVNGTVIGTQTDKCIANRFNDGMAYVAVTLHDSCGDGNNSPTISIIDVNGTIPDPGCYHYDNDGDQSCDDCGESMPHDCVDDNGDYYCDICGEAMAHDCVDADYNCRCDICGAYFIYPGLSGTAGMHAPDTYRENGVTMKDGEADKWILNNRADGISGVDNIGFRGWAFIGDGKTVAIKEFGYGFKQVEGITWGFEPIVDKTLYAPLGDRSEVRRYDITIDLTGLDACRYDIYIYVKGEDGSIYMLNGWKNIVVKNDHTDADSDHYCDKCGKKTACVDADISHYCDTCDDKMPCTDDNNDHICDVYGETISECVNDNRDHLCDICGKKISECADTNGNHHCNTCGSKIPCIDENRDHCCDVYGEKTACTDSDNNHYCDICGENFIYPNLTDGAGMHSADVYYENGVTVSSGNAADWIIKNRADGISGVDTIGFFGWTFNLNDTPIEAFGYSLYDGGTMTSIVWNGEIINNAPDINNIFGVENAKRYKITIDLTSIDICEYKVYLYVKFTDGSVYVLDAWKNIVVNNGHTDADGNHNCDICGATSECVDEDNNHHCDICGKALNCVDSDNNHYCDVCGVRVSSCASLNNDHYCDICGIEFSNCADNNNDHYCDVCGAVVSECTDSDNNHICELCGIKMPICEDVDQNHHCDICDAVVSKCYDKDDHKCDVCEAVISECADADNNHNCDVCGAILSECVDSDNNYYCDVCLGNCPPVADSVLTLEEAIAVASTYAHNVYTTGKYYITATVKEVYQTKYGNMHVIDENGNQFTIYGTNSADGSVRYDALELRPVAGDIVTLYGVLGTYNGVAQMKAAWITEVEFKHEHSYADATCATPEACACGVTRGETLPHNYAENGVCVDCEAIDFDAIIATGRNPVVASKTIAELMDELGWTGSTHDPSFMLDDIVSANINGPGNTGNAVINYIRIDSPGTLTISVPEGYELLYIKVSTRTTISASLCVDGSTTDISNTMVAVSGNSIVLNVVDNGWDDVSITAIEVVYSNVHDCTDNDNDHKCDVCGAIFSECADSDNNHYCDTCDAKISTCGDYNRDHKCDICGVTLSECADNDSDHYCDICGTVLSECADDDNNHFCDICSQRIYSACIDSDNDYWCDVCAKLMPHECTDADNNHKCDTCEAVLSECADDDNNHFCDICSQRLYSACIDSDNDYWCDVCAKLMNHECVDSDSNHQCDACGLQISECIDDVGDHYCDVCGAKLSECVDSNYNSYCDICGATYVYEGLLSSGAGNMSADAYYENAEPMTLENAADWILANRARGISGVDVIRFTGWAYIGDATAIESVGYAFNLNRNKMTSIYWMQDYYITEAPDVANAFQNSSAIRYTIEFSTQEVSACKFDVYFYVKLIDGRVFMLDLWQNVLVNKDCVDSDSNHHCDFCKKKIECTDENLDHLCDVYGERLECADKNEDHYCDACKKWIDCQDNDGDDFCDMCDTEFFYANKTIGELISELGWTSSTTKQSFTLDGIVNVKVNGGSNSGKAYNQDHIRIYATDSPAGTLTISVPEGYELLSIRIVAADAADYAWLCIDGQNDVCNKTVAVSGDSVVLTTIKNGYNGKQVRIYAIEVEYRTAHECIDNGNDHCCDICDEIISACVDKNLDHYCDICYEYVCLDNDNNHKCDACGETLSECVDNDINHLCDICGATLLECVDNNNDHYCDICGTQISECIDEDWNHYCDVCFIKLSDCYDTDDHLCDVCGNPYDLVSSYGPSDLMARPNTPLGSTFGTTLSLSEDGSYVTLTMDPDAPNPALGTNQGTDYNWYFCFGAVAGYEVTASNYMVVKYRTSATNIDKNEMFIGTGSIAFGAAGSNINFTDKVICDGEWNYLYINFEEYGVYDMNSCNALRFDFIGGAPKGSTIDIASITFYKTDADAQAAVKKATIPEIALNTYDSFVNRTGGQDCSTGNAGFAPIYHAIQGQNPDVPMQEKYHAIHGADMLWLADVDKPIDCSKYSKMIVTFTCDRTNTTDKFNANEGNNKFELLNFETAGLAYGEYTLPEGDWMWNTCEIDISGVDYNGELLLRQYNNGLEGIWYVIHSVVFVP